MSRGNEKMAYERQKETPVKLKGRLEIRRLASIKKQKSQIIELIVEPAGGWQETSMMNDEENEYKIKNGIYSK